MKQVVYENSSHYHTTPEHVLEENTQVYMENKDITIRQGNRKWKFNVDKMQNADIFINDDEVSLAQADREWKLRFNNENGLNINLETQFVKSINGVSGDVILNADNLQMSQGDATPISSKINGLEEYIDLVEENLQDAKEDLTSSINDVKEFADIVAADLSDTQKIVDELDGEVTELQVATNELEERTENLEFYTNAISGTVELYNSITEEKLSGLVYQDENLTAQISVISEDLDTYKENSNKIHNAISGEAWEARRRFENFRPAIEEAVTVYGEIQVLMNLANANYSGIIWDLQETDKRSNAEINKLKTWVPHIEEVVTKVPELQMRYDASLSLLNTRIRPFEEMRPAIEETIEKLPLLEQQHKTDTEALDSRIKPFEQLKPSIEETITKVQDFEPVITAHGAMIEAINTHHTDVTVPKIQGLRSDLETLKSRVDTNEVNINAIKETVTDTILPGIYRHDSILVGFDEVNTVKSAVDLKADKTETKRLRKQVRALRREIDDLKKAIEVLTNKNIEQDARDDMLENLHVIRKPLWDLIQELEDFVAGSKISSDGKEYVYNTRFFKQEEIDTIQEAITAAIDFLEVMPEAEYLTIEEFEIALKTLTDAKDAFYTIDNRAPLYEIPADYPALQEMRDFIDSLGVSQDGTDIWEGEYWITNKDKTDFDQFYNIVKSIFDDLESNSWKGANGPAVLLRGLYEALLSNKQVGSKEHIEEEFKQLENYHKMVKILDNKVLQADSDEFETITISIDGSDVYEDCGWVTEEVMKSLLDYKDEMDLFITDYKSKYTENPDKYTRIDIENMEEDYENLLMRIIDDGKPGLMVRP